MWIDDFLDCLSELLWDNREFEKAFFIKHKNLPSKLYKYRTVTKNSIQSLKTDTLWFSSSYEVNDPCHTKLCEIGIHQ